MLSAIIDLSVRKRLAIFVLVAIFAMIGIHAYQNTPVEAFPDVTNLQVNVVASIPGLAPPEVERQVTIPIERAINGTPGLTATRSESLFGLSLLYLTFDDGVDPFLARTLVEQRIRTADLPEGVVPRLGADATPLGEVLVLRLESNRHSMNELRAEAEWNVIPRLRRVAGVADVVARGGYLDEIHVEVDPARLETFGLDLATVRDALERASRNAGGGFLQSGEQQIVVRGVGALVDPRDLYSVVLRVDAAGPVTVGDVARIVASHVPRQGAAAFGSGEESVETSVLMRRGENPSEVLARLHTAIDEIERESLPSGMRIVPFYDRSILVDRTLATVHKSLLEGAFLCVGVVWLFLRSFRGSLIVASVIPLALLTAFIGLSAIDLPANLISMGAIDFGILVDGAVILVENVLHRMALRPPKNDEERIELVGTAAKEVVRPIFFSMAIIIAALVPVFALQSVEGRIFRPLALTYSFALVGALIFSLTFVPAITARVLRAKTTTPPPSDAPEGGDAHAHEPESKVLSRIGDALGRFVGAAYARPKALLLALMLTLGATGVVASHLGREFLPELDEGDFTVFVELPTSSSLDVARQTMHVVRERLMRHPEVREVSTKIGRPEDGTDNESVNMAENYVHLVPYTEFPRGMTKERLYEVLRADLDDIPGIRFNFSQPIRDNVEESLSGVRGKVVLKIYGTDLEVMRDTLLQALAQVRRVPGVIEASLYRDRSVPQLEVVPNRQRLASYGLSMDSVLADVETAVAGSVVGNVWRGERVADIRLRYALADRSDTTRIGDVLVPTSDGTRARLSDVASIDIRAGRASINRDNGVRSLSLKFNIEGRDSGSVVHDAMQIVSRNVTIPEGYTVHWGGEFENQQRAMKRLAVVVPIAVLMVIGLLATALSSVRSAFAVMLVLPWALAGGVFALAMTGVNLSVSAAIGFIALLGQVSLAALLVLGAIDEDIAARGPGSLPDVSTAIAGAKSRLRPVLMTSMLAMLGLFPMAASTAPGSETQRPFALVMVGGMVTTCLVVLTLLPILQVQLARLALRRKAA